MVALLLLVVAGSGTVACLDGHGEAIAVTSASHDFSCPPREGHVHARPLTELAVRSEESPATPDLSFPAVRVLSPAAQEKARSLPAARSGHRILVELCVSRT
ncbi:hypothetical protein [Amycolatopsis keratiniphila]|uniref:Uncharacterized protein n=1 Tax=Amycolatopsis keratiniphila TaxID=129921 RepID=R4SUJ3_9PSEU|nr:hypothetical protein [Amycolatopsis keratiniphila]AGM06220.1 hypothetical protein AORI_3635 [Amycolatopsis keratiniphila]